LLGVNMAKYSSYKDKFLYFASFLIFFSLTFIGYKFFSQSLLYRFVVFFCAIIIPVGILYFTFHGKAFVVFAKKSFFEVKKLVWPTSRNVFKIAALILLVVVLMAVVISLFDVLWNFLIYQHLLGLRS
jgi:preprotein translocase subunit SecE